jgi:hypothetical protein
MSKPNQEAAMNPLSSGYNAELHTAEEVTRVQAATSARETTPIDYSEEAIPERDPAYRPTSGTLFE